GGLVVPQGQDAAPAVAGGDTGQRVGRRRRAGPAFAVDDGDGARAGPVLGDCFLIAALCQFGGAGFEANAHGSQGGAPAVGGWLVALLAGEERLPLSPRLRRAGRLCRLGLVDAGLRWCQSGLRRWVWCGLLVYRCGICLLGWGLVGGGGYSTVGVDADVEFAFGLGDVGGDGLSFAAGAFGQVA